MPGSLSEPLAKLRRSKEHLDVLTDAYCETMGIERVGDLARMPDTETVSRRETNAEGEWVVFERRVPVLPAEEWGLILGDSIHNARSALDLLVTQLLALNGKRPQRKNGFPIYASTPSTQRARQRFKDYLKGLKPDHASGIRKLQPYKNPSTRESWLLKTLGVLDNLDKHQLLHPVWAREDRNALTGLPDNIVRVTPQVPFKLQVPFATDRIEGDVLEVCHVLAPGARGVEIDWMVGTRVAWGFPEVALDDLLDIHSYVVGIVESFAPDFP